MSIRRHGPICKTWAAIHKSAWACVVVPAEQESVILASRYDPSVAAVALTIIAGGLVLGMGIALVRRVANARRLSYSPA
jgi:hypothetical protein